MNGYNNVVARDGNSSAMTAGFLHERKSDVTRIWMVDDNASFRRLLADLLEDEMDFKCERQFASPPAVLAALVSERAPDIILLDVEMGEYNGLDAIRPIKALAPGTHVLMLTTFAGPGGRERAFREGASDFMLKTWEISEISAHIRQAMEFGTVAGLMTAFLTGGTGVTIKPKEVEIAVCTSRAERWLSYLRSVLKFSTS
jgi:DNA-binding NarL/FixJ family response regulator